MIFEANISVYNSIYFKQNIKKNSNKIHVHKLGILKFYELIVDCIYTVWPN